MYVCMYVCMYLEWPKVKNCYTTKRCVSTWCVSYKANERERKKVLNRFPKTARVGADVTTCGRLFQRRLPVTGKARRSPTAGNYLHPSPIGGGTLPIDVNTHPKLCSPIEGCVYCSIVVYWYTA